jgi:hypothetical protein
MILPGWHEAAAKYDLLAFTPGIWDGHDEDRKKLILLNPDIMLGSYFNCRNLPWWMGDQKSGYGRDLWDALYPYVLRDDAGNIASAWSLTWLYNFTDPTVRHIAAEILAAYVKRNKLDWLFLDDVSYWYADGSNLPAWLDRETTVKAMYSFMAILHDLMPNVLLIPNGILAMEDDEFAKLVDGAFVEKVPNIYYGPPPAERQWSLATSDTYPFSIPNLTKSRYRNGKGVVMLQNKYNEKNDFWDAVPIDYPDAIVCIEQRDEGLPPEI